MGEHHLHSNRLAKEKSPYLLQHAHNPVDWYPWGDEAFAIARHHDKPIFLSIGYATCHWCHVMEKESFEDPEIARLLNEVFVNIKVDREELPEVDALYMEFAQSMISGAAGWPLNVILTPDLKPFFAATYLPPEAKRGMIGIQELILRIKQVWNSDERERIEAQAEKIVEIFGDAVHVAGNEIPPRSSIPSTLDLLYKLADPLYGGLKGAPKFPIGYHVVLFLEYSCAFKDSRSLFLAERTLVAMQRGGIYDHLGGGFSRYSVDERWRIPHFEKMLYDNALLAESYIYLWQATRRQFYRTVSEEVLQYSLRVLTHFQGGYYSAEDADTEGEEGGFYTWHYDEIDFLLQDQQPKLFCDYYHVTPEGNFEEGRNILYTETSPEEFAASKGLDPQEFTIQLEEMKQILWKVRQRRSRPFKDDKIITSWNGLMIHSMALAGAAYHDHHYFDAAVASAIFLRQHLWREGKLLRRYRDESSNFYGNLDDYAFLIRGLITLFETQQGTEWLEWAIELTDILEVDFKALHGAFYQTDGKDPTLILRKCQYSDGAEPSGNAIHCENLLRLYQITGRDDYLHQAEDIFKATKKYLDSYPAGYCYHVINLIRYYNHKAPAIVIALNESCHHLVELKQILFTHYIPQRSLIWKLPDDRAIDDLLPEHSDKKPIDGQTTLYICYEGACQKPITELSEMIEVIHKLS